MQKVAGLLFISIFTVAVLSFSKADKEKINWVSVTEMNELYSKNPKPILLDVYTDWCGWCKEMDRTTYKNDKVVKYINEHYYAVRLNAESREKVIFNNKQYASYELAQFLLFNRLEFPTTVFMAAIDAQPAPLAGYLRPKEMEAPLKFFGEGAHKTTTFVEFNKSMKTEW